MHRMSFAHRGARIVNCFRKHRTQMDANDNVHKPTQNMQSISQPLWRACVTESN